ncbi:MAG: hypothetical protein ACFCBV_13865 [Phycisphaerales bacterium]
MSTKPPSTRANGSNGVIGRLRSLHAAHHPGEAHEAEDVSDELAALFLGDATAEPNAEPNAQPSEESPRSSSDLEPKPVRAHGGQGGRTPSIALVVLGNLPVFAGAWASQLARDRQKQLGRPLGLLTVNEESARLEVFGVSGRPIVEAPQLGAALEELANLDADLLVRLPEAEAGWIGANEHVTNITLLTGADDPAIVAAYRSLKAIVQDLPSDADVPGVRVAIAGSEPAVAGEASNKLAQASSRFLGLPVDAEAPVAQIDAGTSAELFHGLPPAWADLPDLLSRFASQPRSTPEVQSAPVSHATIEPRSQQPQPIGFEAQGAPSLAMPSEEPAEPTAKQATLPESGDAIPSGLTRVDVKCPYANRVGIAVDGDGVLHAVAWADDANACSSAVRDLVVASSWLRDHAELIAVLLGKPLSDDPAERHLVLTQGRGALGLAQGELKVHVSVPDSATLVDLN